MTSQEMQELQELEELERLESQYGQPQQESGSTLDSLNAFIRGTGKEASYNYLNEANAALEPVVSKVADVFTGKDVAEHLPDYDTRVAQNVAEEEAIQKAHPVAFGAGQLAGAVGSPVNKVLGVGKAASTLGKIGQGALRGAAGGALYNPGAEGSRVSNAMTGAGVGAALPAIGAGIKAVGKPLGFVARKAAGLSPSEAKAFMKDPKAVKDIAKLVNEGKELEVTRKAAGALEEGIEGLNKGISERAPKVSAMLEGKSVNVPDRVKLSGGSVSMPEVPRETSGLAANRLRQYLDRGAKWKSGSTYSADQVAAKEDMASRANEIRRAISEQVPETAQLNKEMAERYRAIEPLEKALRSGDPDSIFRKSEIGNESVMQLADELLGSDKMSTYSNLRSAARPLTKKGGDLLSLTGTLFNRAGMAGLEAGGMAGRGIDKLTGPEAQLTLAELLANTKR